MRTDLTTAFHNYLTDYNAHSFVTCWHIQTQTGQVLGFTNHTRDVTFNGTVYQSVVGLESTAVSQAERLDVGSLAVTAFLNNQNVLDLEAGRYDHAQVDVFILNPHDLTMDALYLKRGYLGEITRVEGRFQAEVRGLMQGLSRKIGRVYSTLCDARLGDERCRVDLRRLHVCSVMVNIDGATEQITRLDAGSFLDEGLVVGHSVTISGSALGNNVTAQITAVTKTTLTLAANLTTENGVTITYDQETNFSDAGTVASVDVSAPRRIFTVTLTDFQGNAYANHWFREGNIMFTSGNNDRVRRDIRSFVNNVVTVYLEFPFDVVAGATFEIQVGCDKTLTMCKGRFDNVKNHRGFPHVPTVEAVFDSPVHG